MEEPDRPLVFYYSRERRLARASRKIREMNDGNIPRSPGLFRTLTSTKPLTLLFISIVTLCVLSVFVSFLMGEDQKTLGGNALRVSALSQGGKSYITLTKTVKEDDPYTGAVNVGFSLPAEEGREAPVYAERVYFTLENEENFRFIVPFSGPELLVLIEEDEERLFLKIKSE
ncbi:MAG: hypothetical protein LBQ44_01980 [Treponema sp.]|jgi:hypothetical protein|nr:hypothetical protein [Treponema sp.]